MSRNSARMLAIRSVEAGKLYLPMVILYVSTPHGFDGLLASSWTVVFWYYTCTRVHFIFFDWWTTRYRVTDQGVRHSTGLFVRDEILIRWREMASVQVSRPMLQRALGCSLIRIGLGAKGKRSLVLEAISDGAGRGLAELFRLHGLVAPEGVGEPVRSADDSTEVGSLSPSGEPLPTATVVYEIGRRDYLLISITYGQFALFIPFVVGGYSELSPWLPLPSIDFFALVRGSASSWTIAAVAIAVVVGSVGYGCAVAWLRYRSFKVQVSGGMLNVTGGLISQESRQVQLTALRGLKIQQNPAMRALGYAKLSMVSRESARKVGSNVIFPAARLDRIAEGIEAYFPAYAGILPHFGKRRIFGSLLAIIGGAVCGALLLLVHALYPAATPVVAGVSGPALLVIGNYLWTSIDLDEAGRWIHFSRGFIWVTKYELPASSVHLMRRSQGPIGRCFGVANSTLFVFDARRVRLRIVGYSESMLARIDEAVRVSAAPTSQRVRTLR